MYLSQVIKKRYPSQKDLSLKQKRFLKKINNIQLKNSFSLFDSEKNEKSLLKLMNILQETKKRNIRNFTFSSLNLKT
jgi:hypothetical protein